MEKGGNRCLGLGFGVLNICERVMGFGLDIHYRSLQTD